MKLACAIIKCNCLTHLWHFMRCKLVQITAILNVNSVGVAPIILMIIQFDPSVESTYDARYIYIYKYIGVLVIYAVFKSSRYEHHCSMYVFFYSSFFSFAQKRLDVLRRWRDVALGFLQCHLRNFYCLVVTGFKIIFNRRQEIFFHRQLLPSVLRIFWVLLSFALQLVSSQLQKLLECRICKI